MLPFTPTATGPEATAFAELRLAHFIDALRERSQLGVALRDEDALLRIDGAYRAQNLTRDQPCPFVGLALRKLPSEERLAELAELLRKASPFGAYSLIAFDDEGRWCVIAAELEFATCVHIGQSTEAVGWELGLVAALWEVPNGSWVAYDWTVILQRRDVAHHFYRKLATQCRHIEASWSAERELSDEERRHLTIVLLCRILFLVFIDAMGWLGYERALVDRLASENGPNIYRSVLEPLFFEALNTPRDERPKGRRFPEIPYLNGGLFARSSLEEELVALRLPDRRLRALFRDVLSRYHFVANGWETGENPIDPGVLGEVFERLMREEFRVATGAFYTPPELAGALVDLTLFDILCEKMRVSSALPDPPVNAEELRQASVREFATPGGRAPRQGHDGPNSLAFPLLETLVAHLGTTKEAAQRKQDARALADEVLRLRILDPAIGSGAFLLATASALDFIGEKLDGIAGGSAFTPEQRRRHIVARQLHGVDISEVAVMISELRLWLWLSTAMTTDEEGEPLPLPNLDLQLRCGDSLLSLSRRRHGRAHRVEEGLERRWFEARERFVCSHGARAKEHLGQLKALETQLAAALMSDEMSTAECAQAALFDERPINERPTGADDALAAVDEADEAKETRMERQRRWADWQARPTFEPYLHFREVFAQGGFDLVIGNPPWMRLSSMPAEERGELQRWYQTLQTRGRTFGVAPDLAAAFFERAVEFAREDGTISLLLPGKLFAAKHGAYWRRFVLEHTSPRVLALCDDRAAGFRAVAYPAVIVASHQRPRDGDAVCVADEGFSGEIPLAQLRQGPHGDAPWSLASPEVRKARRRLLSAAPPLSDHVSVRYGVKTGCNKVYVNPPFAAHTLPLVRGATLREHETRATERAEERILIAHDHTTGAALSEVDEEARAWLELHRDKLIARSDYRDGEALWQLARVYPESFGWRVAWPDIGKTLAPRVLAPVAQGGPIALNTVYYVGVPCRPTAFRLCAWLRTSALAVIAPAGAMRARGGYRRFDARCVGRLPVPAGVLCGTPPTDASPSERVLWQRFIDSSVASTAGATSWERELDTCAARAQDLADVLLPGSPMPS